jgi:hypothetical protein
MITDLVRYLLHIRMAKNLSENARKRCLKNYSSDIFRENIVRIYMSFM